MLPLVVKTARRRRGMLFIHPTDILIHSYTQLLSQPSTSRRRCLPQRSFAVCVCVCVFKSEPHVFNSVRVGMYTMNRYSMSVDRSVNDLLARVKATLTDEEIAWMSTPDTRNNEPDAYTALQNHFTQKNTDAIVKCASLRYATAVTVVIRRPTHSRSCRLSVVCLCVTDRRQTNDQLSEICCRNPFNLCPDNDMDPH